jgi:prepilin-type N-terminal cleavage/methylation domain-containing protein
MTIPRPTRPTSQSGFTLLEMMVSLALLLVLTGSILGGMANLQKNYRGSEIRSVLNQQMRATMEMMAQEIGQAGLPPSGMQGNALYAGSSTASGSVGTITSSVAIGSATPTVTNSSVQVNQLVDVDTGAAAEVVSIQNIGTNTITATFQKAHTAPFAMYPHGIFPQGITFKNTPTLTPGGFTTFGTIVDGPTNVPPSNPPWLIMFGDISGTGTLSIVQYTCPTAASATFTDSNGVQWGPLVRRRYDYNGTSFALASSGNLNMLDLVRVATTTYPTPADGCRFDYNVYQPSGTITGCSNWWMVTSVNVTLVAESLRNDPQSNAPVIITKSFMNIQPRNILNAYNLYSYNIGKTPAAADNCAEFQMITVPLQTQIGSLTQ